jgi:hypothetical protein
MSNIRTFQISEKYLWGYNTKLDLDEVESIEQAIKIVLDRCKEFLKQNNMLGLVDYLELSRKNFHIHNYEFGHILMSKPEEIVYICCH